MSRRGLNCVDQPIESWIGHSGFIMILIVHTNWITPSPTLTQDPLGHTLRSPSYMMRMWCLTPPVCWSSSAHDTNGTILDWIICQRNSGRALQANIWHPCKPKVGKSKHGTLAPTYKGLKNKFFFNNHVFTKCWLCANDINHCMKGSKKKWLFDWSNIQTVWLVEVGINLTWEEVFTLEDVGFQLHDQEAFSSHRRLGTIPNLPIPRSQFCFPSNPHAHPTTRYPEAIRCNMATPLPKHKKSMGECITHGWLLCGGSDCHPIHWIWLHHNHSLQGGEGLPCVHCI